MANEQNLRPVKTKKEARERGKNGGLASGEARRKQKSLRECVQLFANLKPTDNVIKQLEGTGIDVTDANYLMAMVVGVSQKAMKGDAKALKVIAEYMGEDSRLILDETKFNKDQELKEKEYELRLRELELREKEFEHRVAIENGEVKEEDKVIIINNLDELAKNGKKETENS